jgi:hypothetical protein
MAYPSSHFSIKPMKIITPLILAAVLLVAGCAKKKPEDQMNEMMKGNPHAGMQMPPGNNPHGGADMGEQPAMPESGGLNIEIMMAGLPSGWTKSEPTSSMRVAQIAVAPSKGDTEPGEIAIFHFPGSGGSSAANIQRWQSQFTGPKGEPGPDVAKTDTMMVGLLTVITTDVSGVQLAASSMTGEGKDKPNSRMIASVIETPSGNWFIKAVGPAKTIGDNVAKYRDFLKKAKVKQ